MKNIEIPLESNVSVTTVAGAAEAEGGSLAENFRRRVVPQARAHLLSACYYLSSQWQNLSKIY